jgi:hypothetical protein
MKNYLLEFKESDPFINEVEGLVNELNALNPRLHVTVSEMIIKLAKGIGLNELKRYELERAEK